MITKDDVSIKLKPAPSCKKAGFDKIHIFCFKFFTAVNEVFASLNRRCSRWLVKKKVPKRHLSSEFQTST